MTLDHRVMAVLDEREIAHALIGAAALAAAGVARSTLDLDLLTVDSRVLDPVIWAPLRADGVDVEIRRGDVDDPLGGVVRLSLAGERPVDIILGRHAWQDRAVDRARRLPSGARVVLASDLILLKLYAGGTQDLWDVRQLLGVKGHESLTLDVSADLGDLPAEARAAWATVLAASDPR